MDSNKASEHELVCEIFQVSLTSPSNKIFLQELSGENTTALAFDDAERIIMDVLSSDLSYSPLDYLYGCFERLQAKNLPEVERLVIRYSILALLNPQMFHGGCFLVSRAMLYALIVPFVAKIFDSADAAEKTELCILFVKDWILVELASLGDSLDPNKINPIFALLAVIINHDRSKFISLWIKPELEAVQRTNVLSLETNNLFLATVLSRGPLNARTNNNGTPGLQHTEHLNYIKSLHSMIKLLLSDSNQRPVILAYFRNLLVANHNKAKMQYDMNSVSSFALLYNLVGLWLLFSLPFVVQGIQKVSAIDPEFISKELADNQTKDPWDFCTFINASFLITLKSIKLGVLPLIKYLESLSKSLSELQNSQVSAFPQLKDRLKFLQSSAIAYLSNREGFLEPLAAFIKFTIQWLVSSHPRLSSEAKSHILEDVLDILIWISGTAAASSSKQNIPWTLTLLQYFRPVLQEDALGSLLIICLEGKYINNPHLVAKWVEVLNEDIGFLIFGAINNMTSFMVSLMQFWTEIETKRGGDGAASFYERFSIRYRLGAVLRKLWGTSVLPFRGLLVEMQESPLMVKFVHSTVNDMTFLLDETIAKLGLLSEKGEEGDEQIERECKPHLLLCKETLQLICEVSRITSKPFLKNEIRDRMAGVLNYHLVQLVGPASKKLKIHPSVKERLDWRPRELLAPIISLYGLLGQHASFIHSLKIDGRSFQLPLLNGISSMILNRQRDLVSPSDAGLFHQVVYACQHYQTPSTSLREAIKAVGGDLRRLDADTLSAIEAMVSFEEDVPDEFLDPVMATIMTDPVCMATTSKKIIDRRIILAHLMDDERDPFSRQPLKEDDLVPVDDLRVRIYRWIIDKIKS